MLSNDGLMAMRIYSLYNQSRPLLVFFGVLLLDVIIIGCVRALLYIWDVLPDLLKTYWTVGSGLLSIICYITILIVFGAHTHHWLFRRSLYDIWPVSQLTASGCFAHLMLVTSVEHSVRIYQCTQKIRTTQSYMYTIHRYGNGMGGTTCRRHCCFHAYPMEIFTTQNPRLFEPGWHFYEGRWVFTLFPYVLM